MQQSKSTGPYCYEHPRPAVTVDTAVFRLADDKLQLLLIRRRRPPFAGTWALPGGFVDPEEPLAAAAQRELREETALTGLPIEQLRAFGKPDRDPRGRTISVAFLALLGPELPVRPCASDDADDVAWFDAHDLPALAFDHADIVSYAIDRLRDKLQYADAAARLLEARFTLSALQRAYELILNKPLDKRNFRRRMLRTGRFQAMDQTVRQGAHRPARLYRLIEDSQET